MSDQRELHSQAIDHLNALKRIIDELKDAGNHPLDGDNALLNVRQRLLELSQR